MKRYILPAVILFTAVFIIALCILQYSFSKPEMLTVPLNYSPNYCEKPEDYAVQFEHDHDWSKVVPDEVYTFSTTELPAEYYATKDAGEIDIKYQTDADAALTTLSDQWAWITCSNGIFDSYPSVPYQTIASKLAKIKEAHNCTVTVQCWYWAAPSDDSNMDKVTVSKTFAVNESIADMFEHIFADIYAHPSKPVINIADAGMGTWVLRGKNHNNSRTMSAHSLGTAIDINPSTGSYYINGKWYGNAFNQSAMPTELWVQLPESHKKYHVLYEDSPIVKIFKAYGWYWGGDWSSSTDPMHLAFLGDGISARKVGRANFAESR